MWRRRTALAPVWKDTVAKLSSFTHETRGLSDGHVDGVEAVRHRVDAVAATTPRLGPNGLTIEKETTHDLLSRRRRASMA